MDAERKSCRVLVVDDHKVVRDGVVRLLRMHPCLEIESEEADCPSSVERARSQKYHLAILAVPCLQKQHWQIVDQIRAAAPEMKVVILPLFRNEEEEREAFRRGAHAYVPKMEVLDTMVNVLNDVFTGKRHFSKYLQP